MKVSGCQAWARVEGSKLDATAEECVFMGYADGMKGYRLWSLKSGKLIVRRYVTFVENVFPFKREESETGMLNNNFDFVFLHDDSCEDSGAGADEVQDNLINFDDNVDLTEINEDIGSEAETAVLENVEPEPEPVLRRSERQRKPVVCVKAVVDAVW